MSRFQHVSNLLGQKHVEREFAKLQKREQKRGCSTAIFQLDLSLTGARGLGVGASLQFFEDFQLTGDFSLPGL